MSMLIIIYIFLSKISVNYYIWKDINDIHIWESIVTQCTSYSLFDTFTSNTHTNIRTYVHILCIFNLKLKYIILL